MSTRHGPSVVPCTPRRFRSDPSGQVACTVGKRIAVGKCAGSAGGQTTGDSTGGHTPPAETALPQRAAGAGQPPAQGTAEVRKPDAGYRTAASEALSEAQRFANIDAPKQHRPAVTGVG